MSIQSAIYRIKNRKSGTYFDASNKTQGEIHGWSSRPDNENQKWHVEQSGQGYKIKNAKTNEYASVNGSENGTRVEATNNETEWTIQQKDDNAYAIYVAGTEQVCDLDSGREDNGASINVWYFTGAEQQTWFFEQCGQLEGGAAQQQQAQQPQQQQQQQQQAATTYVGAIPPGTYCIENAFSGTAADLAGGGTADGTPITGYQSRKMGNQLWELIPGQNGYHFKSCVSGTYLGFQGDGGEGTMICGSSQPVEWQVTQADQGCTVHLASNPNVVLDLAGGGNADGVKICLYNNHSGANQQWKFEAPQ